MNAAHSALIGLEHSQGELVFFLESTRKSFVGIEREFVSYGRGEGLVDSPRHPATGVFPPIFPHRSNARHFSRLGVHRGVHRGYIGMPMRTVVPRVGGGRYGA